MAEVAEEVMLEVPPELNAVPDLIMEDEEVLMITKTDSNGKRDEVAWGRRMISVRGNMNTLPPYLGEHKTQQYSIQKTGMSFNKKKMNGRHQINGKGFHRWCFVAGVWK